MNSASKSWQEYVFRIPGPISFNPLSVNSDVEHEKILMGACHPMQKVDNFDLSVCKFIDLTSNWCQNELTISWMYLPININFWAYFW